MTMININAPSANRCGRIMNVIYICITIQAIYAFQPYSVVGRSSAISPLQYSNTVEGNSAMPSFEDRMRDILTREKSTSSSQSKDGQSRSSTEPKSIIEEVSTLQEFKRVVVDDARRDGQIVVVRFYAPWCKACRAMLPGYTKLAKMHSDDNIKFVQVPVTDANMNLHQGLQIPSVPYAHVYHPQGGLVEEQRLTRSHLSGFHQLLRDYCNGSCSLEQDQNGDGIIVWSSESPYHKPKAHAENEED